MFIATFCHYLGFYLLIAIKILILALYRIVWHFNSCVFHYCVWQRTICNFA